MVMKCKKLISTENLSHEEWLMYRRGGIGGSDAGAILGFNPYATPFTVYCDKVGLSNADEDNEAMRIGRDLEQYVADRFAQQEGKRTRKMNYILQHPEHDFMLANVDRLVIGEKAGLECKTASALNRTKFDIGDVPPQYYTQCMHYMAVTGYEKWYLAILVMGKAFHVFEIERDENFIEQLIAQEEYFWNTFVIPHAEPDCYGTEKENDMLKNIYPDSDGGTITMFGEEKQAQRYLELKSEIKELQKEADSIAQNIKKIIGNASVAEMEGYCAAWKPEHKTRFDTKAFKADFPDLYKRYAKESTERKFYIKEISQNGC